MEDEQKGHVLTMDNVKAFLSYPDLAAGMIEVAESGSYDWKQVGVSPTGKNVKIEYVVFPNPILLCLVRHVSGGFLLQMFPRTVQKELILTGVIQVEGSEANG